MTIPIDPRLDAACWHLCTAELLCERCSAQTQDSLLGVVESLVKHSTRAVSELKVVFRLPGRTLEQLLPQSGETYRVEFRLFGETRQAEDWRRAFAEHCAANLFNYRLVSLAGLVQRRVSDLAVPSPATEAALEFFTPYAFKSEPKRPTLLRRAVFLDDLAGRLRALLGVDLDEAIRAAGAGVELLPWYWTLRKLVRSSRSGAGQQQWLKGCTGVLYLKGALEPLLPYLVLAEEMQLGESLTFGRGHFRLRVPGPAYFASRLADPGEIRTAVDDMLERHDEASVTLAEAGVEDETALVESLLRIVQTGTYHPEPHQAFFLPRPDKAPRQLERLQPEALALHLYLHRQLAGVLDRLLEDAAVGYRKGYSRDTAAERIRAALQQGFTHVVESDIEDFFPSIDLDRLEQVLDAHLPEADQVLRRLLHVCLHTDLMVAGVVQARERGLAQGSPLSPLLANLYLTRFDQVLLAAGACLVRYADDFVILARDRDEAECSLALARESLATVGLRLSEAKTAIREAADGFRFLGIDFGPDVAVEDLAAQLRKPVYLTQAGCFLGVSGDTLDIRRYGQLIESLPLHRVSEIIVLGYAALSSTLVRKCTEHRIPVSLVLQSGYHIATIVPNTRRYYDVAYRQAVKYESLDVHARLAIAKEFAIGKIGGYRTLFRQRYHSGTPVLLEALTRDILAIQAAGDTAEVRGLEGAAARRCFSELNHHIRNPALHMRKRERRFPDAINSLLNFCYYLLFTRLNATIRALGLNPFLGFLHEPADRYESLVYDVEELFRARIDRLVLRLINLKTITEEDFSATDRGQRLSAEARRRVLLQFEREMTVAGRDGGVALGEAIHAQAVSLREYFVADRPLRFFVWGESGRDEC